MTDEQRIYKVNVSKCEYNNNGWCLLSKSCTQIEYKSCRDMPLLDCYCKQFKAKEQECERLNNELHKNFKEKNTLHFIIDRLLEASGYDTNTASAEDFEDVYEHMRYDKHQLDQLKAENENWQKEYCKLEQGNDFLAEKNSRLMGCLTEIKEIAEKQIPYLDIDKVKSLIELEYDYVGKIYYLEQRMYKILQKISEVEDEHK